MKVLRPILQIVPRLSQEHEGVGDYARTLADRLREKHDLETTFVAASPAEMETAQGSSSRSPLREFARQPALREQATIILHYVNYGYHPRGIPFWLPSVLRELKVSGRLLTIFHELYALGSWRQSAFWLRPLQMRIARRVARLSESAIVSNEVSRDQLQRLAPALRIITQPVFSNFGEPQLAPAEISERDPHRWAICGGSELIERSFRSFLEVAPRLDSWCAPRELFLIGGAENPMLREIASQQQTFRTYFHPQVSKNAASEILSKCTFGWIDYFVRPNESIGAILKSTALAAFSAHGVITVSPSFGGSIGVGRDRLPGPFFISIRGNKLPSESERREVALSIYDWYQRNSSSTQLAATVAAALNDPL